MCFSLNWDWINSLEHKHCHPRYSQRGRWQKHDCSPLFYVLLSTLGKLSLFSIQAITFSHKFNCALFARKACDKFIPQYKKDRQLQENKQYPYVVDTQSYMRLADIESENWENTYSLKFIPLGYRSGSEGAACRPACYLHLVVLSISGAEFRRAKRGCQLRKPHNL